MNDLEIRDIRNGSWFWMNNAVIRNDGRTLGAYGIAVYAALCMFAGNCGVSEVSVATLAHTIGCSPNRVRQSLRQLEKLGWIGIESRKVQKNGHVVNMPHLITLLSKRSSGEARQSIIEEKTVAPEARQVEAKPETVVVNVQGKDQNACDVYIGRGVRGWPASEWRNPFHIGRDGDRAEVIAKYRDYLLRTRPDLLSRIPELVGKRLGCWCAPEACHGDVLAELALAYERGEWQPPDPAEFAIYDAPALYSLAEIKAVKLTRSQWETLLRNERLGKGRQSVIAFCERKLNAHPLEHRLEEMLHAVDACTVQSLNDPGMRAAFIKVIRTQLWTAEGYYTPEELLEFAKTGKRVENVFWLAGELSKWRAQKQEGVSHNGKRANVQQSAEGDPSRNGQSIWARLGRDEPGQIVIE